MHRQGKSNTLSEPPELADSKSANGLVEVAKNCGRYYKRKPTYTV